ncbi:formamidopyrimidine-DNA glycosylase [Bacteroides heparinolyticus]|uniref:Formamidopyrimidine-DNA glycosylase n=1 Tax=Prevotella heparinolytica TaxID=28113 RepID=A0A4R2MAS4_9BACE|nr:MULTISPECIES: DNA-formamidopyrimidine glycosylase family protein [Bacteroidales]ATR95055.1 DNA-formamidopyrimidine glycosylase [Porphyromonas gingivalis]ATR96249.1 DNA-formamidopyrimidine glycosylase [Porphyromonas gingivalis]TCO95932.1 formamidopyrimidine-DNA glycosylase [Bacteroides heparinolyticus]
MPELPDLAVISENLHRKFANKRVLSFNIYKQSKLNTSASDFKNNIEGQLLKSITRSGKELRLMFSNNHSLGIHLMLKGEIHLLSEPNIKHKIFDLVFDSTDETSLFGGNEGFSIVDTMGQARPILNPATSDIPDALDNSFSSDYLMKILKMSKGKNIKKILRDQSVVRGIGNAYIDEILWSAGISPLSDGDKIPFKYIEILINSTKKTLSEAIVEIQKINPNIISGEERSFLKIHNPNKSLSPNGVAIEVIEIDKKKTYFTNEQILFK